MFFLFLLPCLLVNKDHHTRRRSWWLPGLTWRDADVRAFVFSGEAISVALAASVPEDAAESVLDVVEPVLLPSSAVLALVIRQPTHVLRRVVYTTHQLALCRYHYNWVRSTSWIITTRLTWPSYSRTNTIPTTTNSLKLWSFLATLVSR